MSDQEDKKDTQNTAVATPPAKSFQAQLLSRVSGAIGTLKDVQKVVSTAIDQVRAEGQGLDLQKKASALFSKYQGLVGAVQARLAKKPEPTPAPVTTPAPLPAQEPPKADATKPAAPKV